MTRARSRRRSLRFVLTLWFSAAIVLFGLAAGLCAFFAVLHEATEQVDDHLLQVAELFTRYDLPLAGLNLGDTPDIHRRAGLIVERLHEPGAIAPRLLNLPETLPNGLQTVHADGETWRILVTANASGVRFMVAQRTALRDETAYGGGSVVSIPILILLLVMLIGVGLLLQRAFRPVGELAAKLDQRADDDFSPVSNAGMPLEIMPFVAAINRLLERVQVSVRQQRRFVADAAHELRSPLTALSLQAERLEAADMSAEARQRLHSLRGGLVRAASLLEQLLTLARARDREPGEGELVSLHGLFRQVLETLFPLAEAKGLDLGVISTEDVAVRADRNDLAVLVKNLVDNAIRYTPEGGRVDLAAYSENGAVVLTVTDTGPGIAESERERVLEPFYRTPGSVSFGSGLGLSIASTIVKRHRGSLGLETVNPGAALPGLRVVVRLA